MLSLELWGLGLRVRVYGFGLGAFSSGSGLDRPTAVWEAVTQVNVQLAGSASVIIACKGLSLRAGRSMGSGWAVLASGWARNYWQAPLPYLP